jgi:phosphopantothenate-cysteine ligase
MAVIRDNLDAEQLHQWETTHPATVRAFAQHHVTAGLRICVVTSGGTTVPMERNAVRFVTNFSTGGRGSALCEALLQDPGVAVVFLGRKGSLLPFHRVLQRALSPLDLIADPEVLRAAQQLRETRERLLMVEFETVMEYLHHLRAVVKIVDEEAMGEKRHHQDASRDQQQHHHQHQCQRPVILLAAAVSDYYIPRSEMSEHKMSGARPDGTISLTFHHIPKAMGTLRACWGPNAFIVSFKLETDPAVLEAKASGNLLRYRNDAVIANLLDSYKTNATVLVANSTAENRYEAVQLQTNDASAGLEGAMAVLVLKHAKRRDTTA